MTRVVLITGIGGDISQGVATILRESRPDLRLVGVDAHTQHGGHLFVDAFETVPSASNVNYVTVLQAVIARYAVSIVIPMSEAELAVLLKTDSSSPGLK
jgi:carbamoyl-phosphate synthase large subunit